MVVGDAAGWGQKDDSTTFLQLEQQARLRVKVRTQILQFMSINVIYYLKWDGSNLIIDEQMVN